MNTQESRNGELSEADTIIWKIAVAAEMEREDRHARFLHNSELQLASRLKQGRKRSLFIITRSILRQLIAHYSGRGIAEIDIRRNAHGKPWLEGIEFNLSHSRDWALIALTRDRAVGVDVQYMKPKLDFERISRRRYAPEEHLQVAAGADPSERREQFFAIWTRKEAYIKAHGTSFYDKISTVGVPLGRDRFSDERLGGSWEISSFKIGDEYWASVCAANRLGEIEVKEWVNISHSLRFR
jgi:4'-phosphopantetheinyl transferase